MRKLCAETLCGNFVRKLCAETLCLIEVTEKPKFVIVQMKFFSTLIFFLIGANTFAQLNSQQSLLLEKCIDHLEGNWEIFAMKKPFYTPKLRLKSTQYCLTGDGTLYVAGHTCIGISIFNKSDSSMVLSHPWTADLSKVSFLKTNSLILVVSYFPWHDHHPKHGEITKAVAEFEKYVTTQKLAL